MDQNIRRGLLGTLFAGGLLALGCTAANAADSTSGSDGVLSGTQVVAPVTAPITLGATSLGVLGDSTATTNHTGGTAGIPAAVPAAGATTSGSDGILSGTQVVVPVTAPINLGATSLGLLGDTGATGATTNYSAADGTTETAGSPATPASTTGSGSTTSGSDGLLSGTQVVAPVTAPITVGATSVGVLGDSTATTNNGATNGTTGTAGNPATPATTTGSTTSGSDGILSGTQVVAPVTAPISLGATSLGVLGDSTATTNNGATNGTAGTAGSPATPATTTGSTTSGSDRLLSGTQVVAPVTAPVTLGATSVGVVGDSTATTNTSATNGTTGTAGIPAPAPAASSTSGSDGILSGTQVVAPVTAPITVGATSVGVLGDSTATPNNTNETEGNLSAAHAAGSTETAGNPSAAAGSITIGSNGLLSGAQIVAPISKAVSLGAASAAVSGNSTATVVTPMLANTGADTNLLTVTFLFLGAGLLMMLVARRRKA